jgi:putative nucleotidyltransferase with HDIG domain
MNLKNIVPERVKLIYLFLSVLLFVGMVPLYIFGTKVVDDSRQRLKDQERLQQNSVTRTLSDEINERHRNLHAMLKNLSYSVQVASGGNLTGKRIETPELKALVESFVNQSETVAYATLLNDEAKGPQAYRVPPDDFMSRELAHAFQTTKGGVEYHGQALSIGSGKDQHTVRLQAIPVAPGGVFVGMLGAFVDLQFINARLNDVSQGGLETFVVDSHGRLIATADKNLSVGQDMSGNEMVRAYMSQGQNNPLVVTQEFNQNYNGHKIPMLGTFSPVREHEWAVIAQKTQADAYASVFQMQRYAFFVAFAAVVIIIGLSVYFARSITSPIQTLTASSRAIARGDFSSRVRLESRTEIGELADTFNTMSHDLEQFVFDLKRAAEENRTLFLSSIQMLAGAVDEKDPYTRGHSDRVTRYSITLAKELGLISEEIEKVRIAAQLHDVGKIGIEDRILKKPGALTPDEFEIMKTHTTKGATILRPVEMLKEMIPGIELHHESLDGRGYPHGLKGDQIPLLPRIIMVADTFDAMTTNRPYQAAMDPEYVLRIINSLANTKFDPRVVAAMTAVFERGALRIHRAGIVSAEPSQEAAEEQKT